MIQEIYDYLWIRNVLISVDANDICNGITDKNQFIYIVKVISKLLEREDFPIVFQNAQQKIEDIIQKFRFMYNDKEIVEDINYIIGRLNDYRNMRTDRQKHLITEFYYSENKDRNLPGFYKLLPEYIDLFIRNDAHIFTSFYANTDTSVAIRLDQNDIINFSSLVNLLMNRYPEFFEDEGIRMRTVSNLNQIATIKGLDHYIAKHVKKAAKMLEKSDNKVKRL